ncbi:uracil-DNA glycosylase [Cryomorpha ignava]|uniref:Uracil-DNA glycosylase n=1 Tax=Cryomorpha ignava TaxID=101383 RepID=A0A7K3WVP1_9FLAO|nr:uracil-DNA glycosylase [Cryomorpha ignava]NEN25121.1 uracil-DNA glycosylase [Cryomorpha ignava]
MSDAIQINSEWKEVLEDEFAKPYFKNLLSFIRDEYSSSTIFPKREDIFKAFNATPFTKVKVIILGQDPYYGSGQANGLCFSVNPEVKLPPSLLNIFKEIDSDLGSENSRDGNLERWAQQGVFLLNATLTVKEGEAGSHQNKGWEKFTDAVINAIARNREGLVYLLWGSYAQKKGALISPDKNLILKSVHPSPLSAYRGFLGCKHFSKTNAYLVAKSKSPINW